MHRRPKPRPIQSRRRSGFAQTFIARMHRCCGWYGRSKSNRRSLAFMDCAKQIARRHAVSNPARLNSRLLECHSQGIIGHSRCGPNKKRNVINFSQLAGKDIAPSEDVIVELDRFGGQNDVNVSFMKPSLDADRPAIIDVPCDLRARRQQKETGVSLRQCIRNAVGCSAMIHVEKSSCSLQAFFAGLRVPVARGETLACEIVRPTLVRAGCDNNPLRFHSEYGVHVCHLTGLDPDTGFAGLLLQPCDQTEVFVAARKIDLPIKLPSKLGRAAEQGHIVASLRGDRGRLQSCRAGTDDGDAPSFFRLRRTPARLALLPELRIVDFSKRLAGVYLAPTKIVVA